MNKKYWFLLGKLSHCFLEPSGYEQLKEVSNAILETSWHTGFWEKKGMCISCITHFLLEFFFFGYFLLIFGTLVGIWYSFIFGTIPTIWFFAFSLVIWCLLLENFGKLICTSPAWKPFAFQKLAFFFLKNNLLMDSFQFFQIVRSIENIQKNSGQKKNQFPVFM